MKRASILILVLILMVTLGLCGVTRSDVPSPQGNSPIIGAIFTASSVIGATSYWEPLLNDRSPLVGPAPARGFLFSFNFTHLRRIGNPIPIPVVRQVLLARIRD